uniref:Uncharacterized protein n=1 Tax=Knipowitschia caucasica TaxID=637954 RepID=A0AAV2JYJ0_KNICA
MGQTGLSPEEGDMRERGGVHHSSHCSYECHSTSEKGNAEAPGWDGPRQYVQHCTCLLLSDPESSPQPLRTNP